jgi:hypothetical protein
MLDFRMPRLFETVVDLPATAVLRRRRFGMIEMQGGRLSRIQLRPWPKGGSLLEARLWGRLRHERQTGNCCRLYYNQPWGSSNFLTLRYVVSSRDCTLATIHGALVVLDEIARIKGSDALVCDACNGRISDRLLARYGWEPHTSDRRHRNFIKRFYGEYPTPLLVQPALAGTV